MIAVVCSARVGEFLREIGILPFLGRRKSGQATETQWIFDSKLLFGVSRGAAGKKPMIAVVCSARVGEFLREIGILPF
jgi:hypothetical protein